MGTLRRKWRKPSPIFSVSYPSRNQRIKHETLRLAFPGNGSPRERFFFKHRLQGDRSVRRRRAYAKRAWFDAQRERRAGDLRLDRRLREIARWRRGASGLLGRIKRYTVPQSGSASFPPKPQPLVVVKNNVRR